MKLIDKYLLKNFLAPLFSCLIVFVFMYIIIDLFGHITDILKAKTPMSIILTYYAAMIPFVFVQICPVAIMLSTIYSLNNLNRNNEIVAMRSSGVSTIKVITPFLVVAFLLSLGVFFVDNNIATRTNIVAERLKENYIDKSGEQQKNTVLKNIAMYGKENRVYYARLYDTANKILHDMVIYEHDENLNLKRKISASRVEWTSNGWVFLDGIMYEVEPDGRIKGEPKYFEKFIHPIPEKPKDFIDQRWKPESMGYKKLREYTQRFHDIKSTIRRRLEVELNQRISFPLINFFSVLIGAPLALRWRRGGVIMGIGIAVGISFFLYGVMAIFLSLGKAGIMPPVMAAWTPAFISMITGGYLIRHI